MAAIAASGPQPCCCPGAYYFLREKQAPPVAALRRAGVPMAVATDLNPGTSPFASLRLMANMACILFGLTVEEALAGMTREAARALGLAGRRGVLAPGMDADFAVWSVDSPQRAGLRADGAAAVAAGAGRASIGAEEART